MSAECPCCDCGESESLIYCFYRCEWAARAWAFVTMVLHELAKTPTSTIPWLMLTWKQCILDDPLPPKLQEYAPTWSVLRGSVLWTVWLQRNHIIFHDCRWSAVTFEIKLWDAFLDLARVSKANIAWHEQHNPSGIAKAESTFQSQWNHHGVFFTNTNSRITWNFSRPRVGRFISQ